MTSLIVFFLVVSFFFYMNLVVFSSCSTRGDIFFARENNQFRTERSLRSFLEAREHTETAALYTTI